MTARFTLSDILFWPSSGPIPRKSIRDERSAWSLVPQMLKSPGRSVDYLREK